MENEARTEIEERTRTEVLRENHLRVAGRIADAEREAGRAPGSTLLLAAVKSADAETVSLLHRECGIQHIGENRVQQLLSRCERFSEEGLKVHMIGSLQRNKVRAIIDRVVMIESLDSLPLAAEIDRRAQEHGIVMDVLCEVNSGQETNKGGVLPKDLPAFCEALAGFSHIRLMGMMTMAPKCETEDAYRPYFAFTRELAFRVFREVLGRTDDPVLSMGMSDSYVPAILEGATSVRVGRTLFRDLPD